jgi:hypothetical protein
MSPLCRREAPRLPTFELSSGILYNLRGSQLDFDACLRRTASTAEAIHKDFSGTRRKSRLSFQVAPCGTAITEFEVATWHARAGTMTLPCGTPQRMGDASFL